MPSLLAQPPSMWTLIDNYLLAFATTWAAKWDETVDATIVVGEQYNPDQSGYPFILITSYERSMTEADYILHSGKISLSGLRYSYQIGICGAFDLMTDAKKFAAAAVADFMDDLRADPTFGGLVAANGEFVEQFDFDDSELYVRGVGGQAATGQYTGGAVIALEVHTEVK